MDIQRKINVALIFRGHDAKLGIDAANPREQLSEQKLTKVESRADNFAIDQRYALRLDELI